MDAARKRFLAAAALFFAWVLGLAILAASSGRLPRRAPDAAPSSIPESEIRNTE